MTSTLFWDFTQRRMVVSYRRFGKTYRSHLQELSKDCLRSSKLRACTSPVLLLNKMLCFERKSVANWYFMYKTGSMFLNQSQNFGVCWDLEHNMAWSFVHVTHCQFVIMYVFCLTMYVCMLHRFQIVIFLTYLQMSQLSVRKWKNKGATYWLF
jgi:hypothetical protein